MASRPPRRSFAPGSSTIQSVAPSRRSASTAMGHQAAATPPGRRAAGPRKSIAQLAKEHNRLHDSPAPSPRRPRGSVGPAATKDRPLWHKIVFPLAGFSLSSITDLPGSLWLSIEESLSLSVLEDLDGLGYSCAVALNGAHLGVRLVGALADWHGGSGSALGAGKGSQVDDRLQEVRRLAQTHQTSWIRLTTLLSLFLFGLSLLNAWYLFFNSSRPYRLHHRSPPSTSTSSRDAGLNDLLAGPPPPSLKSPNARLIKDPTIQPPPPPTWFQALKTVSTLLFGWPKVKANKGPDEERRVWQLDVWDPKEFNLRVFVLYPPPVAFLWHVVNLSDHFLLWLGAMAFIVSQTKLVVGFFDQLVKDRATVQQEVMREYNQKFVYPKVFPPKKDACVSTSSAEFVTRNDWM